MNKSFYVKKRKELLNKLDKNGIIVLHSGTYFQDTNDEDFPFSVNRNFFYLTGINQANVILVITKSENENNEYLFLEENDPVMVKWIGEKLYPEEASKISGIKDVRFLNEFDSFIFSRLNPSRKFYDKLPNLYLDLERRFDLHYDTWPMKYSKEFRDKYPEINILNIYPTLISIRSKKEKEEVDKISESIETTKVALENVMSNIRGGLYEYQIETYFDSSIKWNGQKTHSFTTIAASGKNATILHYTANNNIAKDGDLMLFDLGCNTDYYISDISRVYPLNGKFTKRQREIYEIVLNCNKKCIEWLHPGVTWEEYNDYANKLLIEGLKKIGKIKEDSELRKYYWHSIGHSIGLDTHDPSLATDGLQEGMLTTCEPGLYLEDEGIGVRIEDDILITKDGCINLSKDIIKEVDDIEAFMKKNNKYVK